KDKPHIYFLAQKISDNDNLKMISKLVGEYFNDIILQSSGFANWQTFFVYLKEKIKEKMIITIDEFPYLAEANKGISSIFQSGWDEFLKETPVYLIICGSSIAMMEQEVLGYKAPLYGRRTGQILVKPFGFYEASEFFPQLSFDERTSFFSIVGGNPSYLNKINPEKSLEDNIRDNFLFPEDSLYGEAEFILHEELREPRNYFAILRAIAQGKTRISEIVNETGFEKGILHKYLFVLEDLQIIQKEVPVTEKNPLKSRKGIYKLQDQFFKFWFKYILPNRSRIEEGKTDMVLKSIMEDFNTTVAENYEKVAQDIVKRNEERFFPIERIGRWWDRNEEIDVIALNEKENKILFGEAKWSNKPMGIDIYDNLKRKAKLVQWGKEGRKGYYCLFSKSGFTDEMKRIAKKENVMLFHKDKLI
ncbi:MAG: ATP-binding protein, partial [Caldisericaceae bacterium]